MSDVKYHVNKPYPAVSGLTHNKKQAMLLMDGYSGTYSEMSTVAQYAYHKIKCEKHKEVFDTVNGIMLVEMHHLELLGRCIIQLGVDPRYNIYLENKPICWQAGVINYEKAPKEMILANIEGEKMAADYYIKTAHSINNPKLSPLLLRLSEDEKLHVKMFTNLYNKYYK